MNKKLTAAFENSISRGKNEEIGSMDTIKVDGREYYVFKTGKRKFALYEDGNLVALMEKQFEQ